MRKIDTYGEPIEKIKLMSLATPKLYKISRRSLEEKSISRLFVRKYRSYLSLLVFMSPSFYSSRQKILWLTAVTLLYIFSIVRFDFLQGPPMWDEIHYWQTTLLFSDDLIPHLDNWQQHEELSTPLPFVIFGAVEYLFHQGLFGGRLLSLTLSMLIAFIVGWPSSDRENRALRCLIGLCLCTSYLSLNGRLYTEMITCTFVLFGVASYVKNKHLLNGLAFIDNLPDRPSRKPPHGWTLHQRWIIPTVATLSLLGWIYLFKGLAPVWVLPAATTPGIQKTVWNIDPGGAIHSLAAVGAYIVLPELILFSPIASFKKLIQPRRKIAAIAAVLLTYIIFPPSFIGLGRLVKIAQVLPSSFVAFALFYVLALLAASDLPGQRSCPLSFCSKQLS